MNIGRILPTEAAAILNVSPQFVRVAMQMSVIELELDEKEVEESHDHSETFFKCKAYIKHGDIVLSGDERIFDYDFE